MLGFYGEDTCSIAFDGCADLSALRMQGCPALASPGRSRVDHLIAPSLAAVPLPPMQRAARRLFLPPKTSQGFRNSCRERYRLETISNFVNRSLAVFYAQEFTHDDAPTARSMPARGNAPGTCPSTCFALEGRRIPAPLQGATDRFRNPGRCPGLERGCAFSAGIEDFANPTSHVWIVDRSRDEF